MASEPIDKAKLMAFVHGELAESEARDLVARMETDASLRREVENLSRLHSTIAAHYANDDADKDTGAEFSLSAVQLEKIREAARREGSGRQWFTGFAWGSALVAASVAAVMFWVLPEGSKPRLEGEEQRIGGLSQPADKKRAAKEDFGVASAGLSTQKALPPAAPAAVVGSASRLAKREVRTKKKLRVIEDSPPMESGAAESEEMSDMSAASEESAKAESESKYYRLKVSQTLGFNSQDPALNFLRTKLDNEESCVPTSIARENLNQGLRLRLTVNAEGEIQNLSLQPQLPENAAIVACFKAKLGASPEAFKGLARDIQVTLKPE